MQLHERWQRKTLGTCLFIARLALVRLAVVCVLMLRVWVLLLRMVGLMGVMLVVVRVLVLLCVRVWVVWVVVHMEGRTLVRPPYP
jgi:intracellular septation protein A